jgi:hypothetical protein
MFRNSTWPKAAWCIQALRKHLATISALLGLAFFTRCNSSVSTDKEIQRKSVYLANHIDDASLDLLRDFSYGAKGDDNFWLRVSGDTNLYVCNFRLKDDTAKLSIWRPDKFIRDFSSTFQFDTSVYAQFTFSKVGDNIVKIELDNSKGDTLIKSTSVKTAEYFPDKDPFTTFSELTSIAKRYHFTGSSYGSGMGNFFVFWFSPKFKLLYIPDSLQMSPKSKRYWLDEFQKGEKIKQNWSLVNVNEK